MSRRQITQHILMVRPASFGYNPETAGSNVFQHDSKDMLPNAVRKAARKEFDGMVSLLRSAGVEVTVVPDSARPEKTDAVFPNNWVSFHQEGTVITYPMMSPNRRKERRRKVLGLITEAGYEINRRINLEFFEKIHKFLEGTGSLVFDHSNRIAFACLSERTHPDLVRELCNRINYKPLVFRAEHPVGKPVYHTNVVMSVGTDFAVICLDAIPDKEDRHRLQNQLERSEKNIIPISTSQMANYAGNMLQIDSSNGQPVLAMSTRAFNSLDKGQISLLEQSGQILHAPIDTIEKYGGGSARCMMAEIFLPGKNDLGKR